MTKFIHDTCYIDENVKIGSGTKIWHWCHISKNSFIGENCTLGQNVFIGENVSIGNNVKIQNNVSIYSGVFIEDDVFCGPSMVFTNVINPRSTINKKVEFKKTLIKKGASIGANATVICGNTIGNYAFVGAGSVVTKNIKNFSLVVGNPATQNGWVDHNGDRIDLPLIGNQKYIHPKTGVFYILNNNILESK
tara:strand:- start:3178 stop:3753 length:576 start_codon:yes stop_codon:yes gene_type:complete